MLTEADLAIFRAMELHGPLPTPFLFEYVRHQRRDYTHLQNRLTEFYNGDAGGPYLRRPPQQCDGFAARYQHLVYDLTARARHALVEAGYASSPPPTRASSFIHQLMQACIAASFELGTQVYDLRFISRADILAHPKCPPETKASARPFALEGVGQGRALIPDDVFGLEYPGQGYRFFALEADRNTESIVRSRLDQTAFGNKVEGYVAALTSQSFTKWGIPNLTVLTVTTNQRHAENLLAFVRGRVSGTIASRFAFAVEPSFGSNWRVPRAPLFNMLLKPWMTVDGPRLFSAP